MASWGPIKNGEFQILIWLGLELILWVASYPLLIVKELKFPPISSGIILAGNLSLAPIKGIVPFVVPVFW